MYKRGLVPFQGERKAIFKRHLDLIVVELVTIGKVRSPAPLELGAHQNRFHWIAQKVGDAVLTAFEGGLRFAVGVADIHHGVSNTGGEFVAPYVVKEGDRTEHGERPAKDGNDRI